MLILASKAFKISASGGLIGLEIFETFCILKNFAESEEALLLVTPCSLSSPSGPVLASFSGPYLASFEGLEVASVSPSESISESSDLAATSFCKFVDFRKL